MTRSEEKPDTPISKLANIGLQYVRDWRTLFDGIAAVMRGPPGKGGEFYLTDAFQYMADCGKRLRVASVAGWYDCGKVDTLLETNRHLLEQGRGPGPGRGFSGGPLSEPGLIQEGGDLPEPVVG